MRLTPNYRSRLKRRVPPSWGSRLLPLLAFTQSVARQLHPYLKKVKEQIDSPWAISVITHILLLMALAFMGHFITTVLARIRPEILLREQHTQWVARLKPPQLS